MASLREIPNAVRTDTSMYFVYKNTNSLSRVCSKGELSKTTDGHAEQGVRLIWGDMSQR